VIVTGGCLRRALCQVPGDDGPAELGGACAETAKRREQATSGAEPEAAGIEAGDLEAFPARRAHGHETGIRAEDRLERREDRSRGVGEGAILEHRTRRRQQRGDILAAAVCRSSRYQRLPMRPSSRCDGQHGRLRTVPRSLLGPRGARPGGGCYGTKITPNAVTLVAAVTAGGGRVRCEFLTRGTVSGPGRESVVETASASSCGARHAKCRRHEGRRSRTVTGGVVTTHGAVLLPGSKCASRSERHRSSIEMRTVEGGWASNGRPSRQREAGGQRLRPQHKGAPGRGPGISQTSINGAGEMLNPMQGVKGVRTAPSRRSHASQGRAPEPRGP
jgi:hypothetical protein